MLTVLRQKNWRSSFLMHSHFSVFGAQDWPLRPKPKFEAQKICSQFVSLDERQNR
jgi:hypothetical protein